MPIAVDFEQMDDRTEEQWETEVNTLISQFSMNEFREPLQEEKVYKDDCIYCFRTPFFPGGLYVCLTNFVGVCEKHVSDYHKRTSLVVFLNIKYEKIVRDGDEPKDKIPRLADDDVIKSYNVVIFPRIDFKIPIRLELLGHVLMRVVDSVIARMSADVQARIEANLDWEGAPLLDTPVVDNLVQLDVIKQEPLDGWHCEYPGCFLRCNLWLNLSDASVMCGRGQLVLDGNGHALKHARESGFRLVVRIGTIHNGTGEVYLYDFDDESKEGFVYDPHLRQQLAHFGLNIDNFTKTEKNFIELEKSIQFKHDWDVIQEQGLDLEQKYGPGFTGLINLGSSCYMNSVLQTLLVIPDFIELYDRGASRIFASSKPRDCYDDFNCQLAKLISSMNSTDDFSRLKSQFNGIEPKRFKEVASMGHSEFATMKQQDVEHYIRHLCETIDRFIPYDQNPVNALRFKQFERFEDIASGHVRYSHHNDVILPLTIPQKENINGETLTQRNVVTMAECVWATFADDLIEDYVSPVTKEKKGAKQTLRLGSFPDFLFIQLKRFTYSTTGEQIKLSVDVSDVDEIDLNAFRTNGIQLGETRLEETSSPFAVSKKEQANEEMLNRLKSMGFSENAIRKALRFTNNEGIDSATNWLISHLDDADLNEPEPNIRIDKKKAIKDEKPIDEAAVQELTQSFGFSRHQAIYGLHQTDGQMNDAANWLFENIDSVPFEEAQPPSTATTSQESIDAGVIVGGSIESVDISVCADMRTRDGNGIYDLCGFISHIGKKPTSGHYVVHLKKKGVWYIYNDEKVCISQRPPKACGYVYLYKRRV